MKKISKYINNVYFKSIFFTLLIILTIFFLRHLYPFGNETISNADMGQAYLPEYYNLWDIFHGNSGLFFNFNIGAGTNIYDFASIYGFSSPLNWFIILTPRDNIVNFIDYILIIKLLFIALTSSILFRKVFTSVHDNIIVIFSIIYALSGYTIVYYTNFPWLDEVGLFPLVILSLINIVKGKGIKLYVISLALTIMFSFYISYMILLFILFSMGIYLFINRNNKNLNVEKIIFELGLGTIFSLGISSFTVLPAIYQTFHSLRFELGLSNHYVYYSIEQILNKLMILCFYGMPLTFAFKYIFNKKNKKKSLLFILLIFLTTITIIEERFNLMWHTGSYICFPYRFAFIPIMLIYLAALSYFNEKHEEKIIKEKKFKIYYYAVMVLVFLYIIFMYVRYYHININKIPAVLLSDERISFNTIIVCFLTIILTIVISKFKYKRFKDTLIVMMLIIQIICSSKLFIGVPRNSIQREHNDESIYFANDIYNYGKNDKTNYKYKDYNYTLIENYPFISNKPSLSTWHMIDKNQRDVHIFFGYSTFSVKLLDKGGTIFSDQLLGINRIFSEEPLEDNYYNEIGKAGNYIIYEYKNTLPFGIIYDTNDCLNDLNYNSDKVDTFNNIYNNIFNTDDNIFALSEYDMTEDNKYYNYTINIKDTKYLYFLSDVSDIKIKVNGKFVNIPRLNSKKNTLYDSEDQIIYLGEFYDSEIDIKILKNKKKKKFNHIFMELDANKYWNFVNNYKQSKIKYKYSNDKLNIKVKSNKGKSLFLPITYYEGLKATINGKKVEVKKMLGNYITLELENGENNITLSFIPPYLEISILISIISLILFILVNKFILNKYQLKIFTKIFKYLFIIIWLATFAYIYIYPYFVYK